MNNVQIDTKLFLDIVDYFIPDDESTQPQGAEADSIRERLNTKLDKMLSRLYFAKYKTAPNEVERAKAKQEYLKSIRK